MKSRVLFLLVASCALFVTCFTVSAHEARPAHLEIDNLGQGGLDVHWTRPLRDGRALPVEPIFPKSCVSSTNVTVLQLQSVLHESWRFDCNVTDLAGKEIAASGLNLVISDVLLRYRDDMGREHFRILDRQNPVFIIPAAGEIISVNVAPYYFRLGVEHILSGPDHLVFVLALLLLIQGIWRLLKTVTAFTLAHSVTLAVVILGFVNVSSPPVEAVIALSIVFLARELLCRGVHSVTLKFPWLIAACFGLVHGFGFAGGLTEIGLPEGEIPLALLMFNLGVEVGQIGFIIVVLLLLKLLEQLKFKVGPGIERYTAYAIGSTGAFWLVDRLQGFY